MQDIRYKKLADQLIRYSVSLQAGEHVLIHCSQTELPLVKELIRSAYETGAYPHVDMTDEQIQREILTGLTEPQAACMTEYQKARMDRMDAYISMATAGNPTETAPVPDGKMKLWAQAGRKWSQKLNEGNVKWCVCTFPTPLYASRAGMSLDDFERYYFDVCCLDYRRFGAEMEPLRELMSTADRVRITGPGTDLRFSVKGIPACVSAGDRNVPDGEVYTAPVRESIQGTVRFNVPSYFHGRRFDDICLVFRDGKVEEAHAKPDEAFRRILDIDENARYTGEFAFGLNPFLKTPIGMTLFDEKIRGSFHIALGNGLDVVDNGNRSAIHWDLVSLQTKENGGGKIFVDDVLIRENGIFIPEQLQQLN